MKKIQICYKNGNDKTKYVDVILDNSATTNDAIALVKKNSTRLGISPLAYIGRGMSGTEYTSQYNKHKAGTILDGDWNSYSFGQVLVEGGK